MAEKVNITFPDNSFKELNKGITVLDIAKSIGEGLARAAIAGKVDDNIVGLDTKIENNAKVQILTYKDKEGKEVFYHSAAHVFAHALINTHKHAQIAIGPPIENGFHYDFDFGVDKFDPEELGKIENEMKKIVDQKLPIVKKEVSKAEALKIFKDNEYKVEMIKELPTKEKISIYTQGKFIDLCKGPHVPNTGFIKAFKLTKISGAYWKGDIKNKQLTRVYGIAFPDKKELNAYLTLIEEAAKRDHRLIGKTMELFSVHEEAPGMPFFHDKGRFIWDTLVAFVKDIMLKRNYEINKTPIILNKALWVQSGHWDHYKDNMYFTKIDQTDYAVKPMNCPGNILIYKAKTHSYRDLPIRAGEFGLVHRHELSGVLGGLFRVRCFTQDDAHVFCTEEQIKEEGKDLLNFVDEVYSTFGFEYHMELSTKPEKAMGDPKLWGLAETKLKQVLDETGKKYKMNEGEGAFYGPKIDFHLKDTLGRTWQCGTIQLDFQMPEKFNLTYEGKDGKKHQPVMLHRAILGSVERFMGILIEHFAGKFPLWISPVQVIILPIADRHQKYTEHVRKKLFDSGLRVEVDNRTESTSKKVRDAQIQNINYILVVGDKEQQNKTVNIRTRDNVVHGEKKVDDFINDLKKEIGNKEIK